MNLEGANFVMTDLGRYECIDNLCAIALTNNFGHLIKPNITLVNMYVQNSKRIVKVYSHKEQIMIQMGANVFRLDMIFIGLTPANIMRAIILPCKCSITRCNICNMDVIGYKTHVIGFTTACAACMEIARNFTRLIAGRYLLIRHYLITDVSLNILSIWINPHYFALPHYK